MNNVDTIRQCLEQLPASQLDHDGRLVVAAVLKDNGFQLTDLETWIGQSMAVKPQLCKKAWDSLRGAQRNAGIGSLVKMVKDRGGHINPTNGHEIGWNDAIGVGHYSPPQPKQPEELTKEQYDTALQRIIKPYERLGEADLWELSPYRLTGAPDRDAEILLNELYDAEDQLFLGTRYDVETHSRDKWIDQIKIAGTANLPHITPNVFSGDSEVNAKGRRSQRMGKFIVKFKFILCEMDARSRQEQLRFWLAMIDKKVPVTALIDSAGKSIHAWLPIDGVETGEQWNTLVKGAFYERLVKFGCDGACEDQGRLSRLSGHLRIDKDPDTGEQRTADRPAVWADFQAIYAMPPNKAIAAVAKILPDEWALALMASQGSRFRKV